MKRIQFFVFTFSVAVCVSFCGCSSGRDIWEYKTVSVNSEGWDRNGQQAGKFTSITPSDEELNKLGSDGWELTTSYLEMETAWYNFGNDGYVTGLQPNIRPQRVVFIFKRRL